MNMPKSRDIQAKMPSPKVIYASNESKSVLARNLEECRDNDKNSQSVFLSFKCILARNCEGTEQLPFWYVLSVDHQMHDLPVCLKHTLGCQFTHTADRIFHTFFDNSLAPCKLMAAFYLHMVSHQPSVHS